MKNRMKTEFLLFCLVFTGSVSLLIALGSEINLKESTSTKNTLNPVLSQTIHHIHINNNWSDMENTFDWVTGSGTAEDPYLIESLIIDAQNTGSGILIELSTDYFIIRNCSIHSSGVSLIDAGIQLNNVTNGLLIDNNCSNNGRNGIMLRMGCEANQIINNTAAFNDYYGIYLWTDNENNLILGNNIYNNSNPGIYIYTQSNNNIVQQNLVKYNGIYGIYITSDCESNLIDQNSLIDTDGIGIRICSSSHNNDIINNYFEVTEPSTYGGIQIVSVDNITVEGNFFKGFGDSAITLVDSENTLISENRIMDCTYAIYLGQNCCNNTLTRNYISDCLGQGFYIVGDSLLNCQYNFISYNLIIDTGTDSTDSGIWFNHADYNSIYGNILYSNYIGIDITGGAQNNSIYYNTISSNDIEQGLSFDATNIFNNSIIGNYWSDYAGVDSNGDGIGDSIYDISGTANSKDFSPLMNIKPLILWPQEDLEYEIGTNGNLLEWIAADASGFLKSYKIRRDGGLISSNSLIPTIVEEIEYLIDGLEEGTYFYTLEVEDIYGETSMDEINVVVTNAAPSFSTTPSDHTYQEGTKDNTISWIFNDISTNGATYSIYKNGVKILSSITCTPSSPIVVNVDNSESGTYIYEIEVDDGYGKIISDVVIIQVIAEPKIESEEEEESEETEIDLTSLTETLIVLGIIIAIIIATLGVVIILALMKLQALNQRLVSTQARMLKAQETPIKSGTSKPSPQVKNPKRK